MSDIKSLIERLEKGEGQSWDFTHEIGNALGLPHVDPQSEKNWFLVILAGLEGSIDAALSLVERVFPKAHVSMDLDSDKPAVVYLWAMPDDFKIRHKSPSIAILLALLKAVQASGKS